MWCKLMEQIGRNLYMKQYGMPEMETIISATIEAAKLLRVEDN